MEVVASNAGLLTNVEVLDIIKENRAKRSALNEAKVELQGRELVETKVKPIRWKITLSLTIFCFGNVQQTIKYVSGKSIGSVPSDASEKCLKEIKALNLGLTEGELVQIVNLAPRSEVEFYLVRCSL